MNFDEVINNFLNVEVFENIFFYFLSFLIIWILLKNFK